MRDYGTATWSGGDPGCDHKKPGATKVFGNPEFNENRPSRELTDTVGFRDVCGKCGAHRIDSQLGLEATPADFVAAMTGVFAEVKRVLRDDGTCWINIGDSYNSVNGFSRATNGWARDGREHGSSDKQVLAPGLKPKDLVGIPWRVAFALQADGWYLRSDIIWHKPNPMPESVTDRPTKSHEYIFLMAKQERYFYDNDAIRQPSIPDSRDVLWGQTKTTSRHGHADDRGKGMMQYRTQADGFVRMNNPAGRNIRSVWTITPQPFKEAHFATFPVELAARCISAGTSERGACPTCGAPWERVTEHETLGVSYHDHSDDSGKGMSTYAPISQKMNGRVLAQFRAANPDKQLGWRPTCSHDAEPRPCTVFDPFMGAATTIVAAEQLGRLGRGIELSPQYVAIALERLEGMGLNPVMAPT